MAQPDVLESDDFGDFMADLGATPVSADESVLAIRDATIEELRRNLQALRPLGDQLAETEKARLALESQLAEQRVEEAHSVEAHHAELTKLAARCRRAEAGREKVEERLRKLRAKFDRRDEVATERWHKIRAMQQELKALRAEVKGLTRASAIRPDPILATAEKRQSLAKLLDPNPSADPDVAVREVVAPRNPDARRHAD